MKICSTLNIGDIVWAIISPESSKQIQFWPGKIIEEVQQIGCQKKIYKIMLYMNSKAQILCEQGKIFQFLDGGFYKNQNKQISQFQIAYKKAQKEQQQKKNKDKIEQKQKNKNNIEISFLKSQNFCNYLFNIYEKVVLKEYKSKILLPSFENINIPLNQNDISVYYQAMVCQMLTFLSSIYPKNESQHLNVLRNQIEQLILQQIYKTGLRI